MGLIARHLEAAGIPTLSMTSARSITQSTNAPRAAFLDYPLGHTAGRPNQVEEQLNIVRNSLGLFQTLDAPGQIETLLYTWSQTKGDLWKEKLRAPFTPGTSTDAKDDRTEREIKPQYQYPEDERQAGQGVCDTCIWLA